MHPLYYSFAYTTGGGYFPFLGANKGHNSVSMYYFSLQSTTLPNYSTEF